MFRRAKNLDATTEFAIEQSSAAPKKKGPPPYAGVLRRTIAFLVDISIIIVISALIVQLMEQWLGLNVIGVAKAIIQGSSINGESSRLALFSSVAPKHWALVILSVHAVALLYNVIFELLPLHGTPGKVALGIEVTNKFGDGLGFSAAFVRHLGKYLSSFILFIGYLMPLWSEQKQTLHDRMAASLVVKRQRGNDVQRYEPMNAGLVGVCSFVALIIVGVQLAPLAALVADYPVEKLQTHLAVRQVSDVVEEVEDYAVATEVWPDHIGKLGIDLSAYLGGYVENIEVVNQGEVVMTLKGPASLNGKRLIMSPSTDGDGYIRWTCKGTAVSAGLTGSSCLGG